MLMSNCYSKLDITREEEKIEKQIQCIFMLAEKKDTMQTSDP